MSVAGTDVAVVPDRRATARSLVAATLAGVGEGALWSLPVGVLWAEAAQTSAGPFVTSAVFAALFPLGVVVAWSARKSRRLPAAGVVVALTLGSIEAFVLGSADVFGASVILALSLGATLRVLMLATREWRDPATGAFGWGTVVLLVEVSVAGPAGWGAFMPIATPMFFLAVLASRAVTMWPMPADEAGEGAPPWPLVSGSMLVAVAAAMALAVALGARGGVLQGMGRLVIPLAVVLFVFVGFAVTEKTPSPVRERGGRAPLMAAIILVALVLGLILRARNHPTHPFRSPGALSIPVQSGGADGPERVIGLLLLVVVALLIMRAFRARWMDPDDERPRRVKPPGGRLGRAVPFGRRRRERGTPLEFPADTVRRWYAEALLLLERRNLVRPVGRTPAEFAGEVAEAFPASEQGFRDLTAAYEDVRYGDRTVSPRRLKGLEERRRSAMRAIRDSPPLEDPDESGEDGQPQAPS